MQLYESKLYEMLLSLRRYMYIRCERILSKIYLKIAITFLSKKKSIYRFFTGTWCPSLAAGRETVPDLDPISEKSLLNKNYVFIGEK